MKNTALLASTALAVALATQTGVRPGLGDPRTPIHPQTTPGDSDSVFRIDEPGSYYLIAPLEGEPGSKGIEIAASDVTIDLMGFPMTGLGAGTDAIFVEGPTRSGIVIENGSIRGWGEDGLDLTDAHNVRLQNLIVSENLGAGAKVGEAVHVGGCSFESNGVQGLQVSSGLILRDTFARNNGGKGIEGGFNSLVEGALTHGNGGVGVYLGNRSAISHSMAHDNQGVGLLASDLVSGSVASSNSGNGIQVSYGVAEGNSAKSNGGEGVYVSGLGKGNAAYNNDDSGIRIGLFGGMAEGNVARGNDYSGVYLGGRSVGQSNAATWNNMGLRADILSLVRENYCVTNSGQDFLFAGGSAIRGPVHSSGNINLGSHPGVNVGD